MAIFIKKEFVEIPFYFCIQYAIFFFGSKPLINRRCVFSFYSNFFCYGKRNAIIFLAECLYLCICSRLLATKIVCWESNDHQFIFILFVKCFEVSILRCIAT